MLNQSEILISTSSVTPKPETSEKRTAWRSDHELQLARRIDWRFLLPEPYLRRVAYFGREEGTLPSALKHFSESLRVNSVAENASFDLVVLHLSEISSLAKVYKVLVPGGFLYWEMKPPNWAASLRGMIKRSPRPLREYALWPAIEVNEYGLSTEPHEEAGPQQNSIPNRWRRPRNLFRDDVDTLERLGFGDIQIHWQRPNFERCLEMIPMNDDFALDYVFSRPRGDLASQLKFAAGRVMMQTGLLAHLTPCFSLVACKS